MSCSAKNCVAASTLQCGRCKQVQYCGDSCQRAHWNIEHRSVCKPIGDDANEPCNKSAEALEAMRNKYFAGYDERPDRRGTSFMAIMRGTKVDIRMSDFYSLSGKKSEVMKSSVMMTDVMTAVTYFRDEWQRFAREVDAEASMPRFVIGARDRFSVTIDGGQMCFYRFAWSNTVVWAHLL